MCILCWILDTVVMHASMCPCPQKEAQTWWKKDSDSHTGPAYFHCVHECVCACVSVCLSVTEGFGFLRPDWTKSEENPLWSHSHSLLSHFSFINLPINITWFALVQTGSTVYTFLYVCLCLWGRVKEVGKRMEKWQCQDFLTFMFIKAGVWETLVKHWCYVNVLWFSHKV